MGGPAASHPVPRQHPLVGRDHELRHLHRALRDARHAGPGLVLVAASTGLGRTRLLDEFRRGDTGAGARVHVSCGARDRGLTASDALAFAWSSTPGTPVDRAGAGPSRDAWLFRAAVEELRRRALASPPLLVTIDDLHDGHPSLLELLPLLLRSASPLPLLVVASYRDDVTPTPPFRALLVGLRRNPAVSRLRLSPLPPSEVRSLVLARLDAAADGPAADVEGELERVLAVAGGVPRLVEELVATRDRGQYRLPDAFQQLVLDELGGLRPAIRRLLELVAVGGVSVQHDLLQVVSGLTSDEVDAAVDELLDAALLVRERDGESYRVRNRLLCDAVLAELRPTARRQLHRRVATALTERPWLVRGGPLVTGSELVRHWREAGDADRAFEAALRAADLAEDQRNHAESYRLQRAAVELHERCSAEVAGAHDLGSLLRRAGHSADRAGHPADSVALLERACTEVAVDERPLVQLELARAQYLAGDQLGAASTALEAMDGLPADAPDAIRSVLTAMTAYRYLDPDLPGTPLEATTQALELARRADDSEALVHALCAHALQQAAALDPLGAQASIEEADGFVHDVEDPRLALRPALWRLVSFSAAGLVQGVVELGRDAAARADRLGVGSSTGQQIRSLTADALLVTGAWDEADHVIEDGLLAGDAGLTSALLLLARAELAVGRGRFGDADDDLTLARERLSHEHPRWSLIAAELCWWRRNVVAAQQHAARARALAPSFAGPGLDVEAAASYLLVRSSLAARQVLGERSTDRLVEEVLAALAPRIAHPLVRGWHAMTVAETATTAPERAGAWSVAHASWAEVGSAPGRAYCAWRAGRAALEVGDRTAASDALTDAHSVASELGATPLLLEVRATAAAAGLALTSGASEMAGHDPPRSLGLTDREAEVLALLAEGWTNRRIAEHIGVSPRTVGSHVSHILRKLGVSTRGEAVAVAQRLDPARAGYVI